MVNNTVNFYLSGFSEAERMEQMADIIRAKGHNCKYLGWPFQAEIESYGFNDKEPSIYFGQLGWVGTLSSKTPLVPGAVCDFDKMKCSYYYGYFHKYLWNRQHFMVTWDEFKRDTIRFAEMLAKAQAPHNYWNLFIRPDSGGKCFTGTEISHDNYEQKFKEIDEQVKPHTLIVVSVPNRPKNEYRFWVNGKTRRIIAQSSYRIDFKKNTNWFAPTKVIDYVTHILQEVGPRFDEELYIIDIGWNQLDEIGIIELNAWSCSGTYNADLSAIVDESAAYAIREWNKVQ